MNVNKQIDNLWDEFQLAIDQTYTTYTKMTPRRHSDAYSAISDYYSLSGHDDLGVLFRKELANEKQHRRAKPAHCPNPLIFASSGAKLIILRNVCDGAKLADMPSAIIFLQFRQTAAEAMVLGFIIRHALPLDFASRVRALDYSKLMAGVK